MTWTTLLLLFFAALAAAQEPAAIRGRTFDSLTGQPLQRVHIRILQPRSDVFEGSPSWGALSDDQGRFSVASIPPGQYLVQALLPGYFYIPKSEKGLGLTVKAGERIEDFRMELSPRAILSGRVVTADGSPVERAKITREPASDSDFSLVLALQMAGNPWFSPRNADGEFRIALPPGKFRLRVQRDSVDTIGPDGVMTQVAYGDTYYPGVVEAIAGHEVSGLEIRLGASKPLSISGTVSGVPAGTPAEVKVLCRSCGDRPSRPVSADGSFLATGLMPDTYLVWAQSTGDRGTFRSAIVTLKLSASAVSNIVLQLHPLGKISGTVQLAKGLSDGARVVRLQAEDSRSLPPQALSGAVSTSGAFTIDAVPPDLYRLFVTPMPDGAYIQSVLPDTPLEEWTPTFRFSTEGAVSDIMAPLDLRHGAAGTQLKIVLAPGASISGKVAGARDLANNDFAGFLLAPEGKTDPDDVLRARINKEGEYAFRGLPPGAYRLIHFDVMASGAEASFEKLLEKARRIQLKAGENMVINFDLSNQNGGNEKR